METDIYEPGWRVLTGWRIRLEEEEDTGRTLMKLCGFTLDGGWHCSRPVEKVYLTLDGWVAHTEDREEVYLLAEEIWHRRSLFGEIREEWSGLALKLPSSLRLFAWLWADPADVWGEAEDRELDWISVAKWKARHRIGEDIQSIYLHAVWRKGGRWRISDWPKEAEKKNFPGRLILFLDFSKLYYYDSVSVELGGDAGLQPDGSECCREIGPDSDLIHVRAKWKDYVAERSLFFSIFYRIPGERHVELVKAGWRQKALEAPQWSEDTKDFVLEQRQKRIWKKEMYIYLDNTKGHGTVKITGPYGEKMVDSGVACGMVVPLEEME